MKKTSLYSILALTAILGLSSCGGDNSAQQANNNAQQAERIVPVSATPIASQVVTGQQEYPASVVPLNETELRAEVSGYITNILVADGAYVTKGQRLYEIDRTRYAADVDQAKANLQIAESNYDRVQRDLQRYKKLAEQDAIAKQTLDYSETDLNNQAAQVQAAKAALTTANMNLRRSVIVAPFTGTVGISQVRNGALVSAGTTLLNTISTNNPIAIEFQVNERDIPRIKELQTQKSTSAISVRLPDGTQYTQSGTISTIDRAVDRSTGTLRVRATFQNPNDLLRAGMNVTLALSNTSAQEELVVPMRSVIEQLGVYNIFTVSDSSTAKYREVKLGLKFDDKVVVRGDIAAGQQVIIDGANSVAEGVKVNIENK